MDEINWGIIGCGDVTEIKSGPAFQRIESSNLTMVMRRNKEKAKDFARRHQVPQYTNNANDILYNDAINAVYIATPPSSHLIYALKAIEAGKHVYLEKPMALNAIQAKQICIALEKSSSQLTMAHYRRKLPAFVKVKELLAQNSIGEILHVDIQVLKPVNEKFISDSTNNWRVNPEVSGGGYFYDLAPHHIDLMIHYFGEIEEVNGFSKSTNNNLLVEETVNGIIRFKNGVQFRGIWSFNAAEVNKKDQCIIYGSEGSIEFSFFGNDVILRDYHHKEIFSFQNPKHVQEPMITSTVNYFLGKENNPCPAKDGLLVMETMEKLSNK